MSNLDLLLKKRKKAKETIEGLFENPEQCFVVHYSCESFYNNPSPNSPRITSIAVKSLRSNQITSFSIHQTAEKLKVSFSAIGNHYNTLEADMLKDFYSFVNGFNHSKWIHWNMRDSNYGFSAIEHRYCVLGGAPVIIPDRDKYDLSPLIHDVYGDNYSGHPRLQSLIKMNSITDKDFLSGQGEADAFTNGRYLDLHRSTLRKVDVIHTIGSKASLGTLKTKAWAFNSPLMSAIVVIQKVQQYWLTTFILFIIALLGLFFDLRGLLNSFSSK